ncbi:hypothetical protein [Streptomyces candidus]|uniref:Uncharacterized protein n=1 Tax=Streptomyces candidus TaxID=67283 RepID=A0A7X0HPP3_9ACTN|nr:hypothetical protein [Streptomyces candidus]MBB6440063.1 hypothetical protein [Streptomyces candidus]GHH56200.1 hypothetical protein GCM10018773_61790 [Streptomyces candidus]
MPDPAHVKEIARGYLAEEGADLKSEKAAFLSVDLVHGRIRACSADQYADIAPVLVGSGWRMCWPIPLVGNMRTNAFIADAAEHAENLFKRVSLRTDPDPPGVILYAGAGTAIDAIQRRCAEEWKTFYEAFERA